MSTTPTLAPGLHDTVHETQAAFRQVLDALSRPGQVRTLGPALPGVAMGGAMARLLLSVSDDETPIWWSQPDEALLQWLRFHTGAPLAAQKEQACFVVCTALPQDLVLSDFALGSASAPEFSCTLLVELPGLTDGPRLEWRGPGIQDVQTVALPGLPPGFWDQWQANHASFPQGVDLILTSGEFAMGLPRTTRVQVVEGV
jgi:alpha-D-ribose 1-methylphosphonate 5-triphosphate synthase subunit PhnH